MMQRQKQSLERNVEAVIGWGKGSSKVWVFTALPREPTWSPLLTPEME